MRRLPAEPKPRISTLVPHRPVTMKRRSLLLGTTAVPGATSHGHALPAAAFDRIQPK